MDDKDNCRGDDILQRKRSHIVDNDNDDDIYDEDNDNNDDDNDDEDDSPPGINDSLALNINAFQKRI